MRPKGTLQVEILVGQAHFGTYDVYLWESDGKSKKRLGEGVNADDIPDIIEIPGSPTTNEGRILHWRIRVAALSAGARQPYSVTVIVRQAGATLPGGVFPWTGELDNAPIEIEAGARLVVES
jgi:hypothetical protein